MQNNHLELPKAVEKFARGLLTSTCLTAAFGGSAVAGTINLPITDFPNTAPGVLLPVGTTVVNTRLGELPAEGGLSSPEWFEFQGLNPGDSYILTSVYNPVGPRETSGNGETGLRFSVFTSSQMPLYVGQSMERFQPAMVTGVIPDDGILDVEVYNEFYFGGGEGGLPGDTSQRLSAENVDPVGSSYTVTLTDVPGGVPEPGTAGVVGLGLAGLGAFAARRKSGQ